MGITEPTEKWLKNSNVYRTVNVYWASNREKFCVEFFDASLTRVVGVGYGVSIPEALADACNDLMRRM